MQSCDRCIQQATSRVYTNVTPLYLCTHHWTQHRSAIEDAGLIVEALDVRV